MKSIESTITCSLAEPGVLDQAMAEDWEMARDGLETAGINIGDWENKQPGLFELFFDEWRKRVFEWDPYDNAKSITIYGISVIVEWHVKRFIYRLIKETNKQSSVSRSDAEYEPTFTLDSCLGDDIRKSVVKGLILHLGKTRPKFNDHTLYSIETGGLVNLDPMPHPIFPGMLQTRKHRIVRVIITDQLCSESYECSNNGHSCRFIWV